MRTRAVVARFDRLYSDRGRRRLRRETLRALLFSPYTVRSGACDGRIAQTVVSLVVGSALMIPCGIRRPLRECDRLSGRRHRGCVLREVLTAINAEGCFQTSISRSRHVLEAWAIHQLQTANGAGPPTRRPHGLAGEFPRRDAADYTHQSTTDPEARLDRARAGAKLAYLCHLLTEIAMSSYRYGGPAPRARRREAATPCWASFR